MPKPGLSALLANSGLKARELHQFRLLGERLLADLADNLTTIVAHPARIANFQDEIQAAGDFCADEQAHFTVLGLEDEPLAVFRLDLPLACALVRSALGGDLTAVAGATTGEPPALTTIEARVLERTLPEIFIPVTRRATRDLIAGLHELRALSSAQGAQGGAVNKGKGSEQMVVVTAECSFAAVNGKIGFALPLPRLIQMRTRLAAARSTKRASGLEEKKLRKTLGSARLELSAVLGSVAMSLAEIRALEPGSLLMIQKLAGSPPLVTLQCAGRALARGTVVADRGWYRFLVQPITDRGSHNGDTTAAL